jgi:hypothetical protein
MPDDAMKKLKAAVQGLTYPSESDEPFEVIRWENPQGLDPERVLEAKVEKGRKVRAVPPDEFFGALREADDAQRYEALRKVLESVVQQIKVFRVGEGEVKVEVYLVGLAKADRAVVGVHTVSVET